LKIEKKERNLKEMHTQPLSQPETMSAQEYLELQRLQELEAQEALPFDPSTCLYPKGPIRQRVYSCITCKTQTGKECGVCYSCFISCHTNHKMHELFFKRNFICDCGTLRSSKCNLTNQEREENKNLYNENFNGVNCYCKKVYDQMEENDEMFQCYFCENWYHNECIKGDISRFDFQDYVCGDCVLTNQWLLKYCVDGKFCRADALNDKCLLHTEMVSMKDLKLAEMDVQGDKGQTASIEAKGKQLMIGVILPEDWKAHICKCQDCLEIYSRNNLEFILTEEDNIEPPQDTKSDSFEAGMTELGRMDRIKALDGIRHYNGLKDGLLLFLKEFAGDHLLM
jgi:E3 ubiquitin-protein ligase UBR7